MALSTPPTDSDNLDDPAPPQGQVLYARLVRHARLRQLQLLVALQQCGSVLQAAASLHMSQSAATQALAEMERILGVRLFERHARGIRPTLAGQTLVDTARGVLAALEEAAESLAAIRRGAAAALRLGATPAATQAILSPLLAEFYKTQPRVHIDVQEDSSQRLLPLLLNGGLDAVFCREPVLLPASYVFKPLQPDEPVIMASTRHPLAKRRGIALSALKDSRWVLPTATIAVREIFEREVLAALPDALQFPVSTVSLPVFASLLNQPDAVALVPQSIAPVLPSGAQLCQLDVQLSSPLPPLGVVHRREQIPAMLIRMLKSWRNK